MFTAYSLKHFTCVIYFFIGARSYGNAFFGKGTGPIHIDNVLCRSNESVLVQCMHLTLGNCVHAEDAGVRCTPPGIIIPVIHEFIWLKLY